MRTFFQTFSQLTNTLAPPLKQWMRIQNLTASESESIIPEAGETEADMLGFQLVELTARREANRQG